VTTEGTVDIMAGKAQVETEVGAAGQALFTGDAGDGRIHGDPPPPVRPGSDQGGELVPEHETVGENGVPDAPLPVPVAV
jgi:hypothetical protein